MQKTSARARVCVTLAALGLAAVAVGCGERGSPASPSPAVATLTSSWASVAAMPSLGAPASDEHLNPTELEQRGWTCFAPPVPDRVVCSRPSQGFPTVADPPPADRPATFTFLVFNLAGQFVGTEVLIRTDLYQGQSCESTGEPYIFVPVIGYYECIHTVGH